MLTLVIFSSSTVCTERSCIFATVDMTSSEPEEVVVCVLVSSAHNGSKVLFAVILSIHTYTCQEKHTKDFVISNYLPSARYRLSLSPSCFIQSSSSLPQSCQSIPPTTLLTRLVLPPSPVICTLLSFPDSSLPPTSIFSHLTF
jgi:hypothetical protein